MNRFEGVGRNTKDGELRTTEDGLSIYRNTIAIQNNFKNKDGNYDAEFINYVAYRNTAEYLNKYSKKGTLIALEGRIHIRNYEENEEKKYFTEIVVESASAFDTKGQDTTETPVEEVPQDVPQNTTTKYQGGVELSDNDLPF